MPSAELGVPEIGRFGLKAGAATVRDQSAAAFSGDMGLSTPLRQQAIPARPRLSITKGAQEHGAGRLSDFPQGPRGLTRDQMSVQARMMGIADIFEALTAADRPYKKAMPLSQALAIMRNFKEGGHIDPDLFDVFVERQVYRRYAQAFLAPAQIDC